MSEKIYSTIFKLWLPLAISWFFMSLEQPLIAAALSRYPNPIENLAAFGGIAFPMAMIIEAPILNLLSSSTRLAANYEVYSFLHKVTTYCGIFLTFVHTIICIDPLFSFIFKRLIGAPDNLLPAIQISMLFFIPWSWAIAYRRFHQGVLIRMKKSSFVGWGTLFRVLAGGAALILGFFIHSLPSASWGSIAASFAVLVEALFIGIVFHWCGKPILLLSESQASIHFKDFLRFYTPLACTSVLWLSSQPLGSSGVSRMPEAVISLALWPVVSSTLFLCRCFGVSYQEAAIALFEHEVHPRSIFNFALLIGLSSTALLASIVSTGLYEVVLHTLLGLEPALVHEAKTALYLGLPLPLLASLHSYLSASLIHQHKTKVITQSVVLFLLLFALTLFLGVQFQTMRGLEVAIISINLGGIGKAVWLWIRG